MYIPFPSFIYVPPTHPQGFTAGTTVLVGPAGEPGVRAVVLDGRPNETHASLELGFVELTDMLLLDGSGREIIPERDVYVVLVVLHCTSRTINVVHARTGRWKRMVCLASFRGTNGKKFFLLLFLPPPTSTTTELLITSKLCAKY